MISRITRHLPHEIVVLQVAFPVPSVARLHAVKKLSCLEFLHKTLPAHRVSGIRKTCSSRLARRPWLLSNVLLPLPNLEVDRVLPRDCPRSPALFGAEIWVIAGALADFLARRGALRSRSLGPVEALVDGGQARGASLGGEGEEGDSEGRITP